MLTVTAACNPNFNTEMVGDSHASRLNKHENSTLSMHQIREKFLKDLSGVMRRNKKIGDRMLLWDANMSIKKEVDLDYFQAENELSNLHAQEQTQNLSSTFEGRKTLDYIHVDDCLITHVEKHVIHEHRLLSSDHKVMSVEL